MSQNGQTHFENLAAENLIYLRIHLRLSTILKRSKKVYEIKIFDM